MKNSMFGLCVIGSAFLSGTVQAQCGCGSRHHATRAYSAQVAPMTYAAPMVYSAPMTYAAPATYSSPSTFQSPVTGTGISYVNKLARPLERGTYALQYAVHLNSGKVLYTEFLPQGFTARGMESGGPGRKVNADIGSDGLVNVNDPSTQQVIAIIPR